MAAETNKKAIGVFDSGLGGLTAVKELMEKNRGEKIVYFGDTARVPYGSHDFGTILTYARQDLRAILSKNVKAVLVACGTVSSTSLGYLKSMTDVPIYGVVEPAVCRALELTENKKVAVIATAATIESHAYRNAILSRDAFVSVFEFACPLFVPLVENGHIGADDRIANVVAEEYAKKINTFGADTVILGCTHYPIIKNVIQKHIHAAHFIEAGKEAADYLLRNGDFLHSDAADTAENEFYVSGSVDEFHKTAHIFLGDAGPLNIQKLNIEEF